jgi:hypothetical protein
MTTEEKDLAFRAIAGFCAFFAWVFLAGYVSNVLGKNEEKWKKMPRCMSGYFRFWVVYFLPLARSISALSSFFGIVLFGIVTRPPSVIFYRLLG